MIVKFETKIIILKQWQYVKCNPHAEQLAANTCNGLVQWLIRDMIIATAQYLQLAVKH